MLFFSLKCPKPLNDDLSLLRIVCLKNGLTYWITYRCGGEMVVVVNFSCVCFNSSSNFVFQGHFDVCCTATNYDLSSFNDSINIMVVNIYTRVKSLSVCCRRYWGQNLGSVWFHTLLWDRILCLCHFLYLAEVVFLTKVRIDLVPDWGYKSWHYPPFSVFQYQFQPGRISHLCVQWPRHSAHLCCRGPQKEQTVEVSLFLKL